VARFAPGDLFALLAALGTAVAVVRRRLPDWSSLRVPTQVLAGLGLFFALALASFLQAEEVARSFVEFAAYGVNLVLLILVVVHIRTREQLIRCFRAWEAAVVIAMVGAVVGMVYLFSGDLGSPWTNGPKLSSTFKKSGQLSAYLLPSIPILWYNLTHLSRTRRARAARTVLFVLVLLSLLGTGSRTGFALGAALTLGLFGGRWLVAFFSRRMLLKLSILVLAVAVVGAGLAARWDELPYSFRRGITIVTERSDNLQELSPTRYHQLQAWHTATSEYPLTGLGTAGFYTRFTSLAPAAWKPLEVHNTYLGVWAEIGIPGLIALTLLYLGVFQAIWQALARARDPALRGLCFALLAAYVALVIYGTSHYGLRMRHLWLVFAFGVVAWNVVRRESRAAEADPAPGAPPPGNPAPTGPAPAG
jgi:O-antigen ligase